MAQNYLQEIFDDLVDDLKDIREEFVRTGYLKGGCTQVEDCWRDATISDAEQHLCEIAEHVGITIALKMR